MKTDGSEKAILYRGHYESLSTDGDWLYFSKIDSSGGLYKASIDGSQIFKIYSDRVWNPVAYNGYLYFREYNKGYRIYRIDSFGMDRRIVVDDGNIYDRFVLDDNWIYLSNYGVLKRLSLHTKVSETIFEADILDIGVSTNQILLRYRGIDKNGLQYGRTILKSVSH